MLFLSKKQVLKELERIKQVSAHRDLDGVIAALLLSQKYTFKLEFTEFGNCSNYTQLSLDQHPHDTEYNGLIIDHHPLEDYICKEARVYWKERPTCLIVYDLLSLKDMSWAVLLGLTSEGQVNLCPAETYEQYPELFCKYSYYVKRLRRETARYPLYYHLSSLLSAKLRKGEISTCFKMLQQVRDPLMLLNIPALEKVRETIDREVDNALKNLRLIEIGPFKIGRIHSEYPIESRVATELASSLFDIIILNERTGRFSIRSPLALYIKKKLRSKYYLGGHPGYIGGQVKNLAEWRMFLRDLREIL